MPATSNLASNAATKSGEREIVATRLFNAPRDLVFRMWTDPQHIARWWGPNGFTTTIEEINVKPGGVWRFVMHGPDGRDYQNRIVYQEVVKPERLVYDHVSGPLFRATVTFTDRGGRTEINVRMLFETAELRDKVATEFGAVEGLTQHLGRLAEHLETAAEEFVISRTFDAPRDLMFRLWTEADHLKQWFSPKGLKTFHCTNDLRPGGVMHYGMRAPDGSEIWGKWVHREIVKPERLVFVVSFSDPQGGITKYPMAPDWPREWLSTVLFVERDGKTEVTVRWLPINATESERKTFVSGRESMTGGWTGTFDQLEDHVARTAGGRA